MELHCFPNKLSTVIPSIFSDKNIHVIPVLNSLCRIKKNSKVSWSKPQKPQEISLNKQQNNTINVNKSKNFSIKNNEYLSCTNADRPDFNFFMENYLKFLKGSQKNSKNSLSDKEITLVNKSDKIYRFAPSFNQFYQETKNKFHQVLSNIQVKSSLRNPLNKHKNDERKFDLKKNHDKLNSLLSIQKEKINEKTSFSIEKRAQISKSKFNDFSIQNEKKIQMTENFIKKTKNNEFSKRPLIVKKTKLQKKEVIERNYNDLTDKLISPLKTNEDFQIAGDDDEDLDYYLHNDYFKNK